MTVRAPRDNSRLGALDYALMAVGSALAVYCTGMSVSSEPIAKFFAYGVLLGSMGAYAIRVLLGNSPYVKVDGILYAGAAVCAFILAGTLNAGLPDDGFQPDVMVAARLCWMILLGTVLAWRDGTLLFQAIPAVALFGLVGCYDTFRPAPFYFFAFLLCLSTLLGRAHRREMLRQAVMSGYFNRADAPNASSEFPEQSPELYEDIKRGPWRWIAGPEWALGSALAIVFISLLGAPVIREAVAPISSFVNIAPRPRLRRNNVSVGAGNTVDTSYVVGKGPITEHPQTPVYEVTLDHLRYLRTGAYDQYTGRGWSVRGGGRSGYGPGSYPAPQIDATAVALEAMGERNHAYSFSVRPLSNSLILPLPAETVSLIAPGNAMVRPDGGGQLREPTSRTIDGNAWESTRSPIRVPPISPPSVASLVSAGGIPTSVVQFAQDAARGARTDFERATAIRRAIAERCRYNIKAPAVPSDRDPAEAFLFDTQEGYCDLYATAMTLGARAVGIPARYVIGYLPEAKNTDAQGHYVVLESDYHAWAELFFEGVGWVVFDATEGTAQVPGGGVGDPTNGTPWYEQAWVSTVLNVLIGAGVVALAVHAVRKRRTPTKTPRRNEVQREYLGFVRALHLASGIRRQMGQTADEYLQTVTPRLNGSAEAAAGLNARFVRALYAQEEPDTATIAALRHDVRAFRRTTRRYRPPRVAP